MFSIKQSLFAGVALAAVIAGSTGAFAQTVVDQTAKNYSDVTNSTKQDPSSVNVDGRLGTGASASVGATGAVASTSVSSINTAANPPAGGFGKIDQKAVNTGDIKNNHASVTVDGRLKTGASASVAATGAVASTSFSTVGGSMPGIKTGDVKQTATNGGDVSNRKATVEVGRLSGDGSSASIGATGAVASVSDSSIDSSAGKVKIGDVKQKVSNGGDINNSGKITAGRLSGDGSSVSISATGAVASVSDSSIDSTVGSLKIGDITQKVSNSGDINNSGKITAGGLSGTGSSASVSASGAVASVSDSSINATGTPGPITIASITQTATNHSDSPVTNTGTINLSGGLGTGASASVSAMGAGAVASFSSVKH